MATITYPAVISAALRTRAAEDRAIAIACAADLASRRAAMVEGLAEQLADVDPFLGELRSIYVVPTAENVPTAEARLANDWLASVLAEAIEARDRKRAIAPHRL